MLEENEAGCLAQGVLPAESHAHALHEPPRRVVALEPLPLSGGRANTQLIPPEGRDRHSLRRAAELGVLPAHFDAIAGQIVPADGGAAGVEPDGDHQNPTTRDARPRARDQVLRCKKAGALEIPR